MRDSEETRQETGDLSLSEDVVFEVVGRTKDERMTQKGRKVTFKVALKSRDGKHKLQLTDADPALLQKYPLTGSVPVTVGVCNQTTLDKKMEKAVEEAAEISKQET